MKLLRHLSSFPSANNRHKNTASSGTDHDNITISSTLLIIVSTLYQRHQVNARKHKRNSKHINKQLTNHSLATEQEIAKKTEMVSV